MEDRLRAEYEKYLARYDLKPRKLPSRQEREEAQLEVTRIMYEEAKSRDDPMAESILVVYAKNRERYLDETLHPATIQIEKVAKEIEATIRAAPAFAEKFPGNVFVGEFPTGSINCETVKVDGGYLVLVNSGTLTMLQQVSNFLWRGDPDKPKSTSSLAAADGVAAVLASYVEDGDPYYGPKPLNGGMQAMAAGMMSNAAMRFVIGHEYGHILAGHLEGPMADAVTIESPVGTIEVFKKEQAQEFEADEIGYRLALGVAGYEQFDLTAIDIKDMEDIEAFQVALQQKSLIAAPFVVLAVDRLLSQFNKTRLSSGAKLASEETHPAANDRIKRLFALCPSKVSRHFGFIAFPAMLTGSTDRIVKAMTDHLRTKSEGLHVGNESPKDDMARGNWLRDIMRCVEALRSGDYKVGTLLLADSFEEQRTIFESDADVVHRELVRRALGCTTDIRRTLLDRHNDRRAAEQHLSAEQSGNFQDFLAASLLRLPVRRSFGPVLPPLADLAALGTDYGRELVESMMKEDHRERSSPEAHLLASLLAAWRGDRLQALTCFEAAIVAGTADVDGAITRFIALEKRAMALRVPLDLQQMLVDVGTKALGGAGAARELADLVEDYAKYLDVPLGPLAQRLIDAQRSG